MHDQSLLLALVAVQFFVHAAGWTMSARLFKGWRAPEGQFAAAWLALSAGLMLYVPPLASGHALRNLGDLLIVGSAVLQHRGMALHWRQTPPDRMACVLLGATALVVMASLDQPGGHGWRVAVVCVGVAAMMLATVVLVWRRGQDTSPFFARVVIAGYSLMSIVLLARAVQALVIGAASKVSIDAPRTSNVGLVMLLMLIGGLMNLAQIRLVLGKVLARLTTQAHTDPLTGVANRRGLLRSIERTHERAMRGGAGYVVLMVDVDHFKAINDQHGHAGGDRVLHRVAQALQRGLREGDMVARWGGEEFCVLLPRIAPADAQSLAERLAQQIADDGEPRVTVSIGLAAAGVAGEDAEDVIRRADEALYGAKTAGRNQVVASLAAQAARQAA
ncbi:MAG: GGDEF domain-containing protein [Caldimonas sp.]